MAFVAFFGLFRRRCNFGVKIQFRVVAARLLPHNRNRKSQKIRVPVSKRYEVAEMAGDFNIHY